MQQYTKYWCFKCDIFVITHVSLLQVKTGGSDCFQVQHLETSTAAMANDLLDKTKIIEHYVMESKTGMNNLCAQLSTFNKKSYNSRQCLYCKMLTTLILSSSVYFCC